MWETLAAGLAKVGMDIASSAYNNHEARRNNAVASKVAWQYYQKQKQLDYEYDANQYLNLDKQYFTWQNDEAYKLAQQYAQNSARWTVDGLRRAGINPLLAVSSGLGGASTFGDVQTNSAPRTGNAHFSPGHIDTAKIDAANAAFSGAKTALDLKQTDAVTKNTVANTENTQIDTELKKAQAEKALAEAANAAENGGYTGFASQLMNSAKNYLVGKDGLITKGVSSLFTNSAKSDSAWHRFGPGRVLEGAKKIGDRVRSFTRSSSTPSTARKVTPQNSRQPVSASFMRMTGYGEPRKIVPRRGNSFFR